MTLSEEHPRLHTAMPGIVAPPRGTKKPSRFAGGVSTPGSVPSAGAVGAVIHTPPAVGERPRSFRSTSELVRDLADRGAIVVHVPGAEHEAVVKHGTSAAGDHLAALVSGAGTAVPMGTRMSGAEGTLAQVIFVGDTVLDVAQAHRTGVACVGILGAGATAAELLAAGAIAVYEDINDLREVLDESPLAVLWK
jgi:hypothetical protein